MTEHAGVYSYNRPRVSDKHMNYPIILLNFEASSATVLHIISSFSQMLPSETLQRVRQAVRESKPNSASSPVPPSCFAIDTGCVKNRLPIYDRRHRLFTHLPIIMM